MKIISIMNVKGGVGKTITAANLAEILAGDYGKRVLLVDADAQGDATYYLLGETEDEQSGLYGALIFGGCYDEYVQKTRYRNLDILPGSGDLFWISMDHSQAITKSMDNLMQAIEEDGSYDYIIIDCPPSFSSTSVAAICNSQHLIIPVSLSAFGLRGCRFLSKQVEAMSDYVSDLEVTGILPTMWRNSAVCNQSLALLHRMDLPVFETVIRRTDKVDESTYYAQTLNEYSRFSAAGRDYRAFAKELLSVIDKEVQ